MVDVGYKGDKSQSSGHSRVWLGLGFGSLILLVAMTSLVALNLQNSETENAAGSEYDESGQSIVDKRDISPRSLVSPTVRVVGLDQNKQVLCAGSGTIVKPSGQILTSAQVVTLSENCNFSQIGIAVSIEADALPVLAYEAELLASDPALDIAVIKAVRHIANGLELTEQFSAPTLGNSDEVSEQDTVTLSGFLSVDEQSLQTVETSITGFAQRSGVPAARILQTDSETLPGFAGATATDSGGNVIGVVSSSSTVEELHCLDLPQAAGSPETEAETCEETSDPVNVVRPINSALDIVAEAEEALPIQVEPSGAGSDLSDLLFTNPRFSVGQTDEEPNEIVKTAQAGVEELCLFVDWVGIPAGTSWDIIWYLDGEPRLDYSLRDEIWIDDLTGEDFWVCASDSEGLSAGTYEVGFFIEDVNIFAEGFVLTEDPVDVHEITWTNDIDGTEICSLAINPEGSGPVGLNELPADETISSGESLTIEVAEGAIVVAADDCDGTRLAVQFDGLQIDGSKSFSIGT